MPRLKTHLTLLATVAATALAGMGAGPAVPEAGAATHPDELTADAPVTVVASGLHEPRHLAWGPRGHLLVAEAGLPPDVCDSTDPNTRVCYGLTGSIADISSGRPVRIRTGLPANLNSGEIVGPNALTYVDGRLYVLAPNSPYGAPSWLPKSLRKALKRQYGALLDITGESASVVTNPGKVNYEWVQEHHPELATPDFDANLYAMTPKPGGGFYWVDAASNTLGSIDRSGRVRVLAFVPYTPAGTSSVPTCLDMGRDGAVYVGQLTGAGNSATAANVYRYEPWSGRLRVWQSGFSAITGCGFGANGDFYVTEFDTTGFPPAGEPLGVVIQISKRDGRRTVLGEGKLFAPHGFLAGPDGSVYVANKSIMWPPGQPTSGEVVKIG
jgi:hypothetical protein